MDLRFADKTLENGDSQRWLGSDLPAETVTGLIAAMQHMRSSMVESDLLSPQWLDIQHVKGEGKRISIAIDEEHRLNIELGGTEITVHGLMTTRKVGNHGR